MSQKLSRVLQYLGNASEFAGAHVSLEFALAAPLFDAVSDAEVGYLVDSLMANGDVTGMRDFAGGKDLKLTPGGWARLEPTGSGGIPGRGFVAMSFDPSMDDAYVSGIQPGAKDTGFDALRVDRIHHNEKICDKVLAEIRLAQFVVADFTLQRAGVYFEAGFAMAPRAAGHLHVSQGRLRACAFRHPPIQPYRLGGPRGSTDQTRGSNPRHHREVTHEKFFREAHK